LALRGSRASFRSLDPDNHIARRRDRGCAYLRTGRIEASILTHFALNSAHFFGFTYPAAARTM
jgi:hypothetical protein